MPTLYRGVIEYDGGAYHGWQSQKGVPTVQDSLEAAIFTITNQRVRVHGAGRTDAGVHALGQAAHFVVKWRGSSTGLMRALNAVLPDDVVFRLLEEAPERFDARHHAESKTYRYHILNGSLRAPMLNRFTWHVKPELDTAAFAEAAGMLIGQHDFAAFGAPTEGTPSTVRRIISATVNESRGLIRFSIRGTGFLRYMVRSIVGTLVPVGLGRITPRRFGEILRSCERNLARPTAPPHGLFLVRVRYPDGFADNLPEPYTLVTPHESETGVWEG